MRLYLRIKRILKKRGINQSQLAKMSGVPAPNIFLILNGKVNPTLPTLEKILKALDLWIFLVPKPGSYEHREKKDKRNARERELKQMKKDLGDLF